MEVPPSPSIRGTQPRKKDFRLHLGKSVVSPRKSLSRCVSWYGERSSHLLHGFNIMITGLTSLFWVILVGITTLTTFSPHHIILGQILFVGGGISSILMILLGFILKSGNSLGAPATIKNPRRILYMAGLASVVQMVLFTFILIYSILVGISVVDILSTVFTHTENYRHPVPGNYFLLYYLSSLDSNSKNRVWTDHQYPLIFDPLTIDSKQFEKKFENEKWFAAAPKFTDHEIMNLSLPYRIFEIFKDRGIICWFTKADFMCFVKWRRPCETYFAPGNHVTSSINGLFEPGNTSFPPLQNSEASMLAYYALYTGYTLVRSGFVIIWPFIVLLCIPFSLLGLLVAPRAVVWGLITYCKPTSVIRSYLNI